MKLKVTPRDPSTPLRSAQDEGVNFIFAQL
jgi:hypothetical protein